MRALATFTVTDGLFLLWLESLLPDCAYSEVSSLITHHLFLANRN